MNIFALSPDPYVAATMHCDKHVVKMIVEYAQLLSTTHRLLDGKMVTPSFTDDTRTRTKTVYILPGETLDIYRDTDGRAKIRIDNRVCYNATHANHPAAIWARQNSANYCWLHRLFHACLMEYTHRYEKHHACSALVPFLNKLPRNIPEGELQPFPQTMPPEFQVPNDPILAYRNFYVGSKARFARWTNTPVPAWFADAITEKGLHVADFTRTR